MPLGVGPHRTLILLLPLRRPASLILLSVLKWKCRGGEQEGGGGCGDGNNEGGIQRIPNSPLYSEHGDEAQVGPVGHTGSAEESPPTANRPIS